MTVFLALAIIVAIFLLSVSLILLVIGPTLLLQPRRRTADFYRALGRPTTPLEAGLMYEEINIITPDGFKLNSWLVKASGQPAGTLVYLHGVGDCKIDGIRFARLMHDNRYNILLYDARRHGASDGDFCTYGFYEKYDVVTVIDYLLSRTDINPGRIGLFGTSMGAAVAIQAAAIDRRVAAIAAENSFATLRSIFDDYQKRMIKLPFHFLRNLVIVRSELKALFKATDVSPVDSVRTVRIPILFLYGNRDQKIRPDYSIRLYENANNPKELYLVDGAAHTDLWEIGGPAYAEKLTAFFHGALA
jgi:uncharacterized protein